MRAVWKFDLDQEVFNVPPGSKIIHIEEQHGNLCMWMEVDAVCAAGQFVQRIFRVYGTGQTLDTPAGMRIEHVGSAVCHGGSFVWHVYEGITE